MNYILISITTFVCYSIQIVSCLLEIIKFYIIMSLKYTKLILYIIVEPLLILLIFRSMVSG